MHGWRRPDIRREQAVEYRFLNADAARERLRDLHDQRDAEMMNLSVFFNEMRNGSFLMSGENRMGNGSVGPYGKGRLTPLGFTRQEISV
jgi:hypothetical protein